MPPNGAVLPRTVRATYSSFCEPGGGGWSVGEQCQPTATAIGRQRRAGPLQMEGGTQINQHPNVVGIPDPDPRICTVRQNLTVV